VGIVAAAGDRMNTPHDETMRELVAVYALGGIDATTGECATVREHIAQCQVCREEFKIARAATAALAVSASQTPPAHLRDRILSSLPVRTTSSIAPMRAPRRAPWYVPAAVAAAVVLAGGLWWSAHRTPAQSWAATCVPEVVGCHASGSVTVAGSARLHMQIAGLATLPAGKQYQAWLIPPGGAPKPEPAFSADEGGAGSLDIDEAPVKGAIVAITVEPTGGSQKPTSKPFLIAKLD
jgi:anti-sigma-K factor RskA